MDGLKNKNYKLSEFAQLIGVSIYTLQRWDREGILVAKRTPTGRRFYTYDQFLAYRGSLQTQEQSPEECESEINKGLCRKVVIYARVSDTRKKTKLQEQILSLQQYCIEKGITVDLCIEEYGSGLDFEREKWNDLLDKVMEKEIGTIIVENRDIFIRHGYNWFERFCNKFDTALIAVNDEEKI